MFHFTLFSGSDAQVPVSGLTAVTIFGGADLKAPTLAQRVIALDDAPPPRGWWQQMTDSRRNTVLTIFGATELVQPTLMEEYAALRALLASGTMTRDELRERLRSLATSERSLDVSAITLFGVYEEARPGRKKQLKALENGEKAGLISAPHKRRLDDVADAPANTGIEVLGELVVEMA